MRVKLPSDVQLIAGGVIVAALGLWWLSRKGNAATFGYGLGNAAGTTAGSAVIGTIAGVNDALGILRTSDVVNWANSSSNPMQPVGAWLGGKIYDITHWGTP